MTTDEKNTNRYVTNATASSLAFYAMAFLNNQGYTAEQIRKMREKFSLENLNYKKFNIDELRTCFSNQSAYFLNLYAYMNENDRFKNFTEKVESEKRFGKIFSYYNDSIHLNNAYNRKIFHKHLSCEQMRSDYEEGSEFHPNTGVFSIDTKKDQKYYIMPEDYLLKVGMQLCNSCHNIDLSNLSEQDLLKIFFDQNRK